MRFVYYLHQRNDVDIASEDFYPTLQNPSTRFPSSIRVPERLRPSGYSGFSRPWKNCFVIQKVPPALFKKPYQRERCWPISLRGVHVCPCVSCLWTLLATSFHEWCIFTVPSFCSMNPSQMLEIRDAYLPSGCWKLREIFWTSYIWSGLQATTSRCWIWVRPYLPPLRPSSLSALTCRRSFHGIWAAEF